MKNLKRTEKRLLFILAALLLLAGISYHLAPKEELTVEDVQAFYVNTFAGAQEIVVRPAQGAAAPVTLTGDDAAKVGGRMDALCRYSAFSQTPPPVPAPWLIDVKAADGSWRRNIAVGLALDSPDQPERGKIWIVPRGAGEARRRPGNTGGPSVEPAAETPPAIRLFDQVMNVERPSPAAAQPSNAPEPAPPGPATP